MNPGRTTIPCACGLHPAARAATIDALAAAVALTIRLRRAVALATIAALGGGR